MIAARRHSDKVAIIGGGIAGLAAAFFLGRRGVATHIFEASQTFGGLGSTFEYGGVDLERFYHCMLPSDFELLGLLDSLGMAERIYWKETTFGVHACDRVYPLNTSFDLLGFNALPLVDRFRLGLTGLFARMRSSKGLDGITCDKWLRRLSGNRAFELFWQPMLEAKFGSRYHEVPALWLWSRLNREKSGLTEQKGYIRGGYRAITDRLVEHLTSAGHGLHLRSSIDALDLDDQGRPRLWVNGSRLQTFDRVLFAGPLATLQKISVSGNLAQITESVARDVDMVGVLNVVVILKKSVAEHYWIAVPGRDIPFQGIVETTNLIENEGLGDIHVVHLLRYLHRTDPLFARSDDEVLNIYLSKLWPLFPQLTESDVLARFVFRTPYVEPIYTIGYLEKKPPMELVPNRLYLVTSTQVYPDITSWNGSVGLARRVVEHMQGGVR